MLHRRKRAVKIVKEFDTFPKTSNRIPDESFDRSGIGGIMTVIAATSVFLLFSSELYAYVFKRSLKFSFTPDIDWDERLKLNVDVTVAMPCHSIGADVVDSTDQGVVEFGTVDEIDTIWQLSDNEKRHLEDARLLNTYLTEEYHAIHTLLYQSTYRSVKDVLQIENRLPPGAPADACRVVASLTVNKVSGNFHITAGKAVNLPGSHIHISAFTSRSNFNFSHRIHHLSFGDTLTGVVHPLDGEEKVTHSSNQLYQYLMEVVPVDLSFSATLSSSSVYQLSVKENARVIDHDSGSHGVPGIFFKYTMSPLRVSVSSGDIPPLRFFISLFSTIAGITVSLGIIRDGLQWFSKRFSAFQ